MGGSGEDQPVFQYPGWSFGPGCVQALPDSRKGKGRDPSQEDVFLNIEILFRERAVLS
jgi:hypothetical protein